MALFKTTEQLKNFLAGIDINTDFNTLLPFIKEAEQQYIIPLIGQTLFDEIDATYNDNSLEGDNLLLLPYIQRPLAYYTQLLSISSLTVTFGDMGIREHTSENSMSAPRWKEEKLQLDALIKADRHADILLKFLETNATESIYASWFADTTLNTKQSGAIIYSTAIANKYVPIGDSRRIFLRMRPAITDIERTYIPRLISKAEYTTLIGKIQDQVATPLTSKETDLIAKLEPLIAKMALYVTLPLMRVSIAETGGLFLYSGTDQLRQNPANRDDAKDFRESLECGPFGYESDEQELIQFMIDNADTYTDYKASNAYTGRPDPGPMWIPENQTDNKHFSV